MAVVGTGIDLVEVARMQRALDRTPRLAARVFTEGELARCGLPSGRRRVAGLAARFAAKEAVAKALGTGIHGFGWRDVEVVNDDDGRPTAVLHGGAAARAARMGITRVHLSLSTGADHAIAQVLLES